MQALPSPLIHPLDDANPMMQIKEVKWEESAWRHLAEAKFAAIKVYIGLAMCVFS